MTSLIKAVADRVWAGSRPEIGALWYANGGLGDELMFTSVAREARAAGRPLHILTNQPEIWRHNRDPRSVQTGVERWFYARTRGWIRTEITHLTYHSGSGRHIAMQMAERASVTLPPDWRPVLAIRAPARRYLRRLVVQNSCRGARYRADTKEWPQDRWCELVQRLAGDFEIVQVGTREDPVLPLVSDLRGQTTLPVVATLIAESTAFVGLESGLMHVAAAVETPAVIIYGGRTRPHETGYAFNRNLTRSPACAGCSLNDGCPHQMICMDIPVGEVEQAVREVAAQPHPAGLLPPKC
jgi:hypothetical protein